MYLFHRGKDFPGQKGKYNIHANMHKFLLIILLLIKKKKYANYFNIKFVSIF